MNLAKGTIDDIIKYYVRTLNSQKENKFLYKSKTTAIGGFMKNGIKNRK